MAETAPSDGNSIQEWLESSLLCDLVRGAARSRGVAQPEDVADVLQETRLALWRKGLNATVGRSWIWRVASHKSIDLVRRRARERRLSFDLAAIERLDRDHEVDHLLRARVEGLTPRLREFYELHYTFALTEREVAAELGLCRASVRWLDRRCRRQLL